MCYYLDFEFVQDLTVRDTPATNVPVQTVETTEAIGDGCRTAFSSCRYVSGGLYMCSSQV